LANSLILKSAAATGNTARLACTRFDLSSLVGMEIGAATLQLQTSTFLNAHTNGLATLMLRRTAGGSSNFAFASKENLSLLPPTLLLSVPEPGRALLLAITPVCSRRRHLRHLRP
jgi:hypothetical protein